MHPEIRLNKLIRLLVIASLCGLAAVGSTLGDSNTQAESRSSEVCLDCHTDAMEALAGTPHQTEVADANGRVSCMDCHPGDVNQHEDDPEEYPMDNPARADVALAARTCSGCHMSSHQQNMAERNVHAANGVNCAECHQVHGVKRSALLKKDEVELCLECHTDVRGEFAQPYRHPVSDGIVRCSECHASLDENKRILSYARIDAACFNCHEEFQGPFPFEHQAAVGYSTQEGGCLACHAAHGSSLPRMLKRPYEPPNFNLCSQCHVVPRHNYNSRHGDEWAGVPCNDCHGDIHGSYVSRYFLSPSLQSQGCFNTGCHQY